MFCFTEKPIDPKVQVDRLRNSKAGACVTFEGWVRDHNEGKAVARLDYEAYVELAEQEGRKVINEAKEKFEIFEARFVHRLGVLGISELAVWIGVTAPHRREAFAACAYIIDELKGRLPIWKKEYYTDGHSAWVNLEQRPPGDAQPVLGQAADVASGSSRPAFRGTSRTPEPT